MKGQLYRRSDGWLVAEMIKGRVGRLYPLRVHKLSENDKAYLVNGNEILFEEIKSLRDRKMYAKITKWLGAPKKVKEEKGSLRILDVDTGKITVKSGSYVGHTSEPTKSFTVTAGY